MKLSLMRTYVLPVSRLLLAGLLMGACSDYIPNPIETQISQVQEPTATGTQESQVQQPTATVFQEFSGSRALELIKEQMAFGNRLPGSEVHAITGDWILENLEESGWSTDEQYFPYHEFTGRNIIGKAGPKDGNWVILGAHYDTRPISDRDENNPQDPVFGANDGASGVAVLLELARVIRPEELDRPVWLVFFDLEDSGGIEGMEWIVGSTYFAESLVEHPVAVIIVDMVGDSDLQLYYEKNSNLDLKSEIWQVAAELGFESFIPVPKYSMLDDHTPFIRLGIPAIDIIDFDYPYWHTTEDTIDKVSALSLTQVGQTIEAWLRSD